MCGVDMVDSALKTSDVALSKCDMFGLNGIHLRTVQSCFLTEYSDPGT